MSSKLSKPKKRSVRRDDDPVRVYSDGRLAYWTGGQVKVGVRKFQRHGTEENAERAAEAMRDNFRKFNGPIRHPDATLADAMQAMLAAMRQEGAPRGTIDQYKSNWNVWVAEEIGEVLCGELSRRHWKQVFHQALVNDASKTTLANVSRTLNSFTSWAVDEEYFADAEPFGEPRRRREIVKKAIKVARGSGKTKRIGQKHCPTPKSVARFAAAFEEEYPGYGERLVMLGYATGLRINELLALRHDSIDLRTGDVYVDWQLNRHEAWPALKRPKGGKPRVGLMWRGYADVAQSLIDDSLALDEDDPHYGWLFPRHRSETAWADQANKLSSAAACDWDWTFHWLRHAYATYSMASKKSGGYGLDPESVSAWLGHTRLSVTLDMYVTRRKGDVKAAGKATAKRLV